MTAISPVPDRGFLRANAPWLAAGGLLTFTSAYGQTFFIAVFSGEIRAEYGLSHGDWGGLYALGTTASAILMIWTGALADRFRIRDLGTWVLAGLALACLAMALLPGVWALPLVILALRLAGQGMSSHLAITAMARWFAANRGRALATAGLGFSLAEATLPILFVALLTVASWRSLWVLAALLVLVSLFFLRRLLRAERTPQGDADHTGAPGLLGGHWTRIEALAHPLFWCLVPFILVPPAFMTALMFHQVHLSEARGMAHLQFVALLPLYTACVVAGMLSAGWLIDRFGANRLVGLSQLPFVLGFVIVGTLPGYPAMAAAMILFGLAQGTQSPVPAACWAELYGTRHIGAIKAMALSVMVFGTALGPVLTGRLIDSDVTLPEQCPWIAAAFAAASALAFAGISLSLRQVRREA